MPIASDTDIAERNGLYRNGSLQTTIAGRMKTAKGDFAERKAREIIGDSLYDEIKGNTSHEHYDQLVEAEALLIFGQALSAFNLRLTEKGGAVSSVGVGDAETEILSRAEVEAHADDAYGQGIDLLEDTIANTAEQQGRVVRHI